MVLWLPSLWSSQIRNLSLQGWWAGFLLSGRVQLPQRHPAENANRKRTWCKNQAWSLKEMSGGQGLNLETMSDNRCLKSSDRSKNSSHVCILLPCEDYTESLIRTSLIHSPSALMECAKSLGLLCRWIDFGAWCWRTFLWSSLHHSLCERRTSWTRAAWG